MTESHALYAASEYDHQCALFDWADMNLGRYPDLVYMFSTLNGVRLPIGLAKKVKRAGMKKGVPDVWLPVPRGQFLGMVFEMKVRGNSLTIEQAGFLNRMAAAGWATGCFYDWQDAAGAVVLYLEGALKWAG